MKTRKEQPRPSVSSTTPVAPDGGWGWMVVLATCASQFFLCSYASMSSLLYVEWIEYFQASAGEVSWIGFLFMSTYGLSNLLVSELWHIMGVRWSAIVGGILMSSGVFIGSWATELYHIGISIGVLTGSGLGISYMSCLRMTTVYFDKRFAIANGLAYLGFSLGQLATPPIFQAMLSYYGWRNAMLLASGVMTHSIATACLLRPIPGPPTSRHKRRGLLEKLNSKEKSEVIEKLDCDKNYELTKRVSIDVENSQSARYVDETSSGTLAAEVQCDSREKNECDNISTECSPLQTESPAVCSLKFAPGHDEIDNPDTIDQVTPRCNGNSNMRRRSSVRRASQAVGRSFSRMVGFEIIRREAFILPLLFTNFILSGCCFIAQAHLVAFVLDQQTASHSSAANLLSIMGAGVAISLMGCSVLGDFQIVRPTRLLDITVMIGAVSCYVIAIEQRYAVAAACAFFAGISIGGIKIGMLVKTKLLISPLYVADGVRLLTLFRGTGRTVGTVISGLLYDVSGSYSVSFFYAGSMYVVATGANVLMTFLFRRREKLLQKEETNNSS